MHIPALLDETIRYLAPSDNQTFIDCTFGEGGHSLEILSHLGPKGRLLGIDYDCGTITSAGKKFASYKNQLTLVCDNFTNLSSITKKYHFEKVDGILLDLGFSSRQLEKSGLGLSFQKNEPLDMRISLKSGSITAQEIINRWPEYKLEKIFKEYANEPRAKKIARLIAQFRQKEKIRYSLQLAQLIEQAFDSQFSHRHPATKVFQALRIAVNHELENLKQVLPQATDTLKKGGKLAVISFHSGEDRIVKNFFRGTANLKILTKKPIQPTVAEIKNNRRSRSAKLRVAQKKI